MSDLNTGINRPSSTPTKTTERSPDALKGTIGKIGESIENISSTAEVIEYTQEKTGSPAQTSGSQSSKSTKTDDITTPVVTQKFIPQTAQAIRKELSSEIKKRVNILIREAKELEKQPGTSFAYSLQKSLREIRRLNLQLSTLLHMTFEKLKEVYKAFFPNAVDKEE